MNLDAGRKAIGAEQAGQVRGRRFAGLQRREDGPVQAVLELLDALENAAGGEGVRVVFDKSNARVFVAQDALGKIGRDIDHRLQKAGLEIGHGLGKVCIFREVKGLGILHDGVQPRAHLPGLRAGVFVHQRHPHLRDLSAKGIAQHHKLHQRENHGRHHQRRIAEKLPHVAFDQSKSVTHCCSCRIALTCTGG